MMTNARFTRLFGECECIIEVLRKRCGFPLNDYDDLKQEMALALLECDEGTDNYCLTRAAWAALAWLRATYATRVTARVITLPDVTALIDSGHCRRVWC